MSILQIDTLICEVLRGEDAAWPAADADFETVFLRRAEYHGVSTLLNERLPSLSGWPLSVLESVRSHALSRAFWELRHQQLLSQVVAALKAADIEPVFFKGTALAYSLYQNPVWRERGDTDIIVAPGDVVSVGEALIKLGFATDKGAGGELVSYQDSYTIGSAGEGLHSIDLHRKINNSELLSRLFTYSELRAEALPLTALAPEALAAGPVHALLLACLHSATHRHNPYYVDCISYIGGDRLIWRYDVHLLARALTDAQWNELVRIASEKGLCAITLESLAAAAAQFHTQLPPDVRAYLKRTGEPVSDYLNASHLRQSWLDFRAIPRLSGRLLYLRELIFPPAVYMRAKYADTEGAPLALLYSRRALEGIGKRFQRR